MTSTQTFHLQSISHLGVELADKNATRHVILDGESLTTSKLLAISRPETTVSIRDDAFLLDRMRVSADILHSKLASGEAVYGVNTGYGGSANTRSHQPKELQHSLLHLLHVGIISSTSQQQDLVPENVVRAAMAIRINSLVRGHSAVSQALVAALIDFLNLNITPCVPMRGSISASGDLIPLAHIVACLLGGKDAHVYFGQGDKRKIVPATLALQQSGLVALEMQPKEGLALLNGTSMSAAMMAIQLLDTNKLACASHFLTAMTVEALSGSLSPYTEFVSDVCRPHPGQCDSASMIRTMLHDSSLVKKEGNHKPSIADVGLLAQDRYSTRTTPQWFGPQLEQLWLAQRQIAIELNSTTDNPLLGKGADGRDQVFNGGNFQAMSVAMPAETIRLSLNAFAKAVFSQLSELVNADLNNGLPANLAGGEPSADYGCKGLEIAAASYMSEISFLANPVTSHVQTAELQNQALNSLALISARYTSQAGRVLFMLMANHIYILCQAVTLRVAFRSFGNTLQEAFEQVSQDKFGKLSVETRSAFTAQLLAASAKKWSLDSGLRFEKSFDEAIGTILAGIQEASSVGEVFSLLTSARPALRICFTEHWIATLNEHAKDPSLTSSHLGASSALYDYIRHDLGVPFNQGGDQEHEISHHVSAIFDALQRDEIWTALCDRVLEDSDSRRPSVHWPVSPPESRIGSGYNSVSRASVDLSSSY